MNFLQRLRDDLKSGLDKHPDRDQLAVHARWIIEQQGGRGGFKNRKGREELYYTTFATRSLSALGFLEAAVADQAEKFLLSIATQPRKAFSNVVSAVSWWDAFELCGAVTGHGSVDDKAIAGFRCSTEKFLNTLHLSDGGWAKTSMEGDSSLYHTFLSICAHQRMGSAIPGEWFEGIRSFLASRNQPAGGFFESRYSKTPGVNGTAAGVSLALLLKMTEFPQPDKQASLWTHLPALLRRTISKELSHHARFIKSMQNEEGGFRATLHAPFADLLSTYTGLFTLELLGQRTPEITRRAYDFARSMEDPAGGFVGFALEQDPDCEYTFYGIGIERIASVK